MQQTMELKHILMYKANIITIFRIILLIIALGTFNYSSHLACFLLMISVILDYFDGMIARYYN